VVLGGAFAAGRGARLDLARVHRDNQQGELALCTDLERPVDDSAAPDGAVDDLVLDGPDVPSA
jgi:hypothetical protein